jgi:hypothetical protein
MPGLDPGIHSVTLAVCVTATEWIAGSSPAMTTVLRHLLTFYEAGRKEEACARVRTEKIPA